jgi:hypothetical protein
LTGAEQRACWTGSAAAADEGLFGGVESAAAELIELIPPHMIEARVTPG